MAQTKVTHNIENTQIALDAAEIPNLDASKITTGDIAAARLNNATVDLQPIKSDISALALREATNESSAAFNLPNQFIDTLTNATNLGTQTNGGLGSGFWATDFEALTSTAGNETVITDGDYKVIKWINTSGTNNIILGANMVVDYLVVGGGGGGGGSAGDYTSGGGGGAGAFRYATSHTLTAGTHSITVGAGGTGGANYSSAGTSGGDSVLGSITSNGGGFGASYSYDPADSVNGSGGGGAISGGSSRRDGGTSGAYGNNGGAGATYGGWGSKASGGGGGSAGAGGNHSGSTGGAGGAGTANSITGSSQTYASGGGGGGHGTGGSGGTNAGNGSGGVGTGSHATANFGGGGGGSTTNAGGGSTTNAGGNGGSGIVIVRYATANAIGTHATGTLIQTANTVSSAKTKVGGTFLYKDLHGTNTIGTDLKIYFTCNGGTNWTEASSYSAITPVYSTGIKQVRLGETTCTSGTDVRYKAVWANQAASSKVAQLHGIGINY